ncbi:MAG: MFS transporter [Fimbriimonadaceae bacterium]
MPPSIFPGKTTADPNEARNVLTTRSHIFLSSYWFSTNFLWGALLVVVLNLQVTYLTPVNQAIVMGLLVALGAIPATLVPLIVGPISDRCRSALGRRKPFVLWGTLICLAGLLAMYFAADWRLLWFYFAAFFIVQVGNNVATGAYSGIIPDLVPKEQRGKASGFMAIMTAIGTLSGAVLAGFILKENNEGSLTLFAILLGVQILGAAIYWFGVQEPKWEARVAPLAPKAWLKGLWISPKAHPDFAIVWITRFLMMFGFYAVQPFLVNFVRDVIGSSNPGEIAALFTAAVLIGSAFAGIVGGSLSDRFGRKPLIYVATAIMTVMIVLLAFANVETAALILGVAFGIGYGMYISVDWALASDVLPNQDENAKAMAVWHVSMTLPQTFSPLIAGSILTLAFIGTVTDSDGTVVPQYAWAGYLGLLLTCAVCFAISGFFVRYIRSVR